MRHVFWLMYDDIHRSMKAAASNTVNIDYGDAAQDCINVIETLGRQNIEWSCNLDGYPFVFQFLNKEDAMRFRLGVAL